MAVSALAAGIGAGLAYLSCVLCCKGMEHCRHQKMTAHQQEDIYNISSQVQNQEQWPTHNAHLSLDHITLMNQMNKSAYDDAPPSYDEVMKASLQNNGGTSTSELPPPPPPSHAVIVVPPTTTTTSQ
ncbi:uncharacterized protein LOC130895668 isoform X6 [Diorhabda carinulata]|uniref:uncharacterized protein LOC130895668 isoform X6 n=1 Tax=Diorhabda carinulata TaxID=1163345 RepID=UPI0025A2E4FF|nr:uncharacterized protein LOC130895668 isoform X6 [Diorhabda carinulata]